MRTTGVTSLGSGTAVAPASSSNVVHLRPLDADASGQHVSVRAPLATSAAAYLEEAPLGDESTLAQVWGDDDVSTMGMPASTRAARERRRQVIIGLTGVALLTLLLAIFAGGNWIAAHVFVDMLMISYVILLVRHRQLAADRMMKVEPIRPPVNEQLPATVQAAPSYLLRSSTGS